MPKKKRIVRRGIIGMVKELKKARKKIKPGDLEQFRKQAHLMIDVMYDDQMLVAGMDFVIKAVEVMAILGDDAEDLADLYASKLAKALDESVKMAASEKK